MEEWYLVYTTSSSNFYSSLISKTLWLYFKHDPSSAPVCQLLWRRSFHKLLIKQFLLFLSACVGPLCSSQTCLPTEFFFIVFVSSKVICSVFTLSLIFLTAGLTKKVRSPVYVSVEGEERDFLLDKTGSPSGSSLFPAWISCKLNSWQKTILDPCNISYCFLATKLMSSFFCGLK